MESPLFGVFRRTNQKNNQLEKKKKKRRRLRAAWNSGSEALLFVRLQSSAQYAEKFFFAEFFFHVRPTSPKKGDFLQSRQTENGTQEKSVKEKAAIQTAK